MRIELRADGRHISGYVNATEKKSRPVMTRHGMVVEEVEPRAFEKAIERAGNINVTVDHDRTHVYASTESDTLKLFEDAIGLHADVLIDDPELINLAKKGKIKGWSFGMYNVIDTVEPRADNWPLRKISSLDLDHITLVVNKSPVYSATSVEVRANNTEITMEERSVETKLELIQESPVFDYTPFKERLSKIKGEK